MRSLPVHIEVVEPARWAARGADVIGSAISFAVAERGQAVVALSGSGTPIPVFEDLAARPLPWDRVTIVQVDERVAPLGSADRNLSAQQRIFGSTGARILRLPVDDGLADGSVPPSSLDDFASELGAVLCGAPLDLVHLGLGEDGHTASLIPGDPLVDMEGGVVGESVEYQGMRRLTLTRSTINQARLILWLVRGSNKAVVVRQMVEGDTAVPAGRIRGEKAILVADGDAVALLP